MTVAYEDWDTADLTIRRLEFCFPLNRAGDISLKEVHVILSPGSGVFECRCSGSPR